MKRALVAVAVGSFGLAGCAYEAEGPEAGEQAIGSASEALCQGKEPRPPENVLDTHLAQLATEVLKCKNSLTASDFIVDRAKRILVRRFECKDQTITRGIDELLGIQLLKDANAAPYFVAKWSAFLRNYEAAGSPTCPRWTQTQEINPPTKENVQAYLDGKGSDKTNYAWSVVPPQDCERKPGCATQRAELCASWASDQFVVCTDPLKNGVVTDPKWWKDPNFYDPNPFLTFGYEHGMAQWGYGAPGDRWGAVMRQGELCSKWDDATWTYTETGQLQAIDCDGFGFYCVSQCMSVVAVPATP